MIFVAFGTNSKQAIFSYFYKNIYLIHNTLFSNYNVRQITVKKNTTR